MKQTAIPLVILGASTFAAITMPVDSAHAACTASVTGEEDNNGGYDYGYGDPESSFASSRLQPNSIASTVNASNASDDCDGYAAPIVSQGMQSTRGLLRDTILRLEKLRATKQAAGKTSMYVTSAIPSYLHAQDTYTRRHDLIVGADHRYNDQWVAGASIGLAHTNFFTNDKADGRVDGTGATFTAYGAWSPTAASYISAAFSAETMHYSLDDDSVFGTRARANGLTTGLSLSAGYDAQLGSWTASPFARFDLISSRMHSLSDNGEITKGLTSSSTIGAQLATQISMNWGILSPHARIEGTRINGWNVEGTSTAQLYGNTAELDRTYGQAGVGAAALLQGGLTLFSDLDRTFGMKGVTSWRFTLGLRTEL